MAKRVSITDREDDRMKKSFNAFITPDTVTDAKTDMGDITVEETEQAMDKDMETVQDKETDNNTDKVMDTVTGTLYDLKPVESMVRHVCYLTKEQSKFVKKMAKKLGVKESEIIRFALKNLMR